MKRTICLILMLAISLSCFACAKPAAPVISADGISVHSQKTTPEPTAEPTAEPTQEPTPEPVFMPPSDPEPIPLPELDFVIDDSAQYTMPWEKSPKEYSKATVELPCNFADCTTEGLKKYYDIEPFEISFALPAGWSIEDEPDENGLMLGFARFRHLFSKQYIFDETGRCIGAFGYYFHNELEYGTMQEIYPGISLGHYRFNFDEYTTVTDLKNTATEITYVLYDTKFMEPFPDTAMYNEQGRLNYGIVSRDPNELFFVAFELCPDYVSEAQYIDIAQSLRFE